MDPCDDNLLDFGSELLRYHGYLEGFKVFLYAGARYLQSAKLHVGLGVAQYPFGSIVRHRNLVPGSRSEPERRRALGFLEKMVGVAPGLSAEVGERLAHFAKLYPDNPAANYYYALSLRQQTNENAAQTNRHAEALLQEAITEDPGFADAHYQLGLIYQDDGMEARAARGYEMAVKLRPDWKSAHCRLA